MDQPQPAPPNLHDIVLPEPVSWMPQTTAWWIVLGLVLAALGWVAYKAVRRWRANRYRRAALTRLDAIEQALADPASRPDALSSLPELVKQTALAFRPRSEVASLSGEPWLRFLDASYGGNSFSEGPGKLLPTLAYKASPVAEAGEETGGLVQLIRRWIRDHDASIREADARA
ncbi:MAG: DUF4381 domain-containing protein [Thermoanaerobaculia bacterium]